MLLASPASQGPVESDAACPGSATPSGVEMTSKHMLHCIQSGPSDSNDCSVSSSVSGPTSCVEGTAHCPSSRFALSHMPARCPDVPYRLRNCW